MPLILMNKRDKLPYHVALRIRLINKEESTKNSRRRELERISGNGWTNDEWIAHVEVHGGKCLLCGKTEGLVPDHVIPLSRGGRHELYNIQPLCHMCNFKKALRIVDYRTPVNMGDKYCQMRAYYAFCSE